MLRPSKKLLFAIEAVLDIAYHAGGEPVQSREITRAPRHPRAATWSKPYNIWCARASWWGCADPRADTVWRGNGGA